MKLIRAVERDEARASFTPTVTLMLMSASAAIRIASPKAMVWLKR